MSWAFPLQKAAKEGNVEFVKTVYEADKTRINEMDDSFGDTPLHWAARRDHVDIARFLLDHNAAIDAPNKNGWTALHAAVHYGFAAVTELLLEYGADMDAVNKSGETALKLAEESDCTQVLAVFARKELEKLLHELNAHTPLATVLQDLVGRYLIARLEFEEDESWAEVPAIHRERIVDPWENHFTGMAWTAVPARDIPARAWVDVPQ